MLRSLSVFIVVLSFSFVSQAQKTAKLPNGQEIKLYEKEIICYSSDYEHHGFNPAPIRKTYGAKGNMPPAQFSVTYRSFPTPHRDAIDHALSILSSVINSPITIHVNADYESIDQEGALAGALFNTTFYDPSSPNNSLVNNQFNFNNATDYNSLFPIALIEKLSGFELTDASVPDINITVNSQANWFTDFQNPGTIQAGQFDLVTIMLHEVMHGLGFAGFSGINGSGTPSNQVATLTSGTPIAFVFDRFIENGTGTKLQDVEDGSQELTNFLQSNNLFFNGLSSDTPSKLYAPPTFNQGSSIYHLDQTTFQNSQDRLMVPFYSTPDVNHEPGLGMELLYDMGWDYTEIDHTPLRFSEDLNLVYTPAVEVLTDSGIDSASLELVYSQDTFKTVTTIPMAYNATNLEFEATLPAPGVEAAYQYYFQVTDTRGVQRSTPANYGTQFYYAMTYGIDDTDPIIDHNPVTELTTLDKNLIITSSGSDFFAGIDKMYLEVKLNDVSLGEIALNEEVDGFGSFLYDGAVSFGRNLLESDVVTYRLRAVDKSQASNESFLPEDESFFTVPVVESPDVADLYEASFDDNTIGDFTLNGFGVELPNNFTDSCLANVMHPYPTAGNENTLSLTAELKVPIKINEADPSVIFDEIVLVEPGEPNTSFGDVEFWDYVIVESRKIGTANWIPLSSGYDAQENASWESLYNSAIVGGTSTASPFQSTYKEHEFSLISNTNFVEGDTVFLRFRLFSDPGASGWGWAINNLKVQDKNSTVSVEEINNLEYFMVYPNPSRNQSEVMLDLKFKEYQSELRYELHNTRGQLIKNWTSKINGHERLESLDISNLTQGVYFISARNANEVTVRKLFIY